MDAHKVFVEVVDSGSFSAAAKRLHKSPSAISKQMGSLEETMSIQLFVRTTRTLKLTEAGDLFYQRSKDIVQRVEETRAELMEFQGSPSGRITITWPNGLSYSNVSNAIANFVTQNPDIRLNVQASTDLVNLVEEKIDFAFRVSELEDSNLIAIHLDELQPMICASPSYISVHGMPKSKEALFAMPYLVPTYVNFSHKTRKMFSSSKGIDKKQHHLVDDITSLYNLAKEGLGAAVIFKHIVQEDLETGKLVDLSQSAPLPTIPLYLVYPKLDFQPKKIRAFIDHFKAYYKI